MTHRRPITSGEVIADRYELHDLVTEGHGCARWRALDTVLNRNVGVELLPADDPRVDDWLAAARNSTNVTDPRFLRVMDIIDDHSGYQIVVREWAKAFSLDQILAESPLPNRRAATIIGEIAEAMASAHEVGVYHRRLSPHQILLKRSGAVRIVGLGVTAALDPLGPEDQHDSSQSEGRDVCDIGKLLYAALTSRWPGGYTDGLEAAPCEHGRLLRPRQVKAGISRDIDGVCDRILGNPPRHHALVLTRAADIARETRLAGLDHHSDEHQSLGEISSPDLLRIDPVIEPSGPPPGLAPPKKRPKAFEAAPPTALERGKATAAKAASGHRLPVVVALLGVILIVTVLGALTVRMKSGDDSGVEAQTVARNLPISAVYDIDPYGNQTENSHSLGAITDGDINTAWSTVEYYGSANFGGLKPGVGLVVDLGGIREVSTVRVQSVRGPVSFTLFAANAKRSTRPASVKGLTEVAKVADAGSDTSVSISDPARTRFLVVWITKLPRIESDTFQAAITQISVRGNVG